MAQRLVTPFINTNIPGAYPNNVVQSQPVGIGSSGNVVIIGEAVGGPDYTHDDLATNFFAPNQLAQVAQKYISGPIVDAFTAFSAPSADSNISGTANNVWIVKTNIGGQASSAIPTSYGTLTDQNYGVPGNQYNWQITSLQAEVEPVIQGNTISTFGSALNGLTFTVRLSGGVETVVGPITGSPANIAALVVELNTLLPVGITASPGTATNSLALTMNPNAAQYTSSFGEDFELYDSTPGDLAALGLTAGLFIASAETEIEMQINRASTNLSETFNISTQFAIYVGYQGTSATLSINPSTQMLTTTVSGGSGANLSVNLAQYATCADVAAFINSQPGYSASVDPSAQQLPPSIIDSQAAVGIASSNPGLQPGRLKDSLYQFETALSTSKALNFTATATAGLPNPTAALAYLTGGSQGGTTAAQVYDAIQALGGLQINMIVPLFSRDASFDITQGLTDSSSTYTISAINAAVKSHCIEYSTPALKRNRIAFLSYWNNSVAGNYSQAAAAAQGIGNYRCSMALQMATQVNSQGAKVSFLPWYTASVAAGMQAGGFYQSICNKLANVISFTDPSGFDSGDPADDENAISAGLLFLTQIAAGPIWASDQTTYGVDTNFVYNSIQAVYDSDILALDLAASAQSSFVGKSLADIDAATVLSFLSQKMDGYRRLKLIAPSSDAPLGYKNPVVQIDAPTLSIQVEIKLATAIYFVPITINISQIQQSA